MKSSGDKGRGKIKMDNSRRAFLKTVAVGSLGAGVASTLPSVADEKKRPKGIEIQRGYTVFDERTQKNMEAFLEIIIPGSEQYGMGEKVMQYVNRDRAAATFFDAGFWNIDAISMQQFKKHFYELTDKEEKLKIVNHVSVANKKFFTQFRYLAMRLYYQDPDVWKSLPYDGPPQTKGFMDYSEPPKTD